MLSRVLFWLFFMPILDLVLHQHPFAKESLVIDLIMLPICLLGAYLEGRWKWQDLEKKYPE